MICVHHHSYLSSLALESEILAHLLALSQSDRYLRFGYQIKDQQIIEYFKKAIKDTANHWFLAVDMNTAFPFESTVVGVAMLNVSIDGRESELAISVEAKQRGKGVARKLMDTVFTRAHTLGVKQVYILTLSENKPMQKLAAHYGIQFSLPEYGELKGKRDLNYSYFDLTNAAFNEWSMAHNVLIDFQKDWCNRASEMINILGP